MYTQSDIYSVHEHPAILMKILDLVYQCFDRILKKYWQRVQSHVFLILQDHDELVRTKEDIEKQLQEQKLALEEQKKRYEEMEVHVEAFHVLSLRVLPLINPSPLPKIYMRKTLIIII